MTWEKKTLVTVKAYCENMAYMGQRWNRIIHKAPVQNSFLTSSTPPQKSIAGRDSEIPMDVEKSVVVSVISDE